MQKVYNKKLNLKFKIQEKKKLKGNIKKYQAYRP
jgi:hypothetical protein